MAETYGVIYKITNKENGKVYIGQTTQGLMKRIRQHRSEAKRYDELQARGCRCLYRAMNKYGCDTFSVEIVYEAHDANDLDEAESFFIKEYGSLAPNGYNIESGGNAGKTLSEETRKMISDKVSILWSDPAYREHMSDIHKGIVWDEDVVRRRAESTRRAFKGKTPEERRAIAMRKRAGVMAGRHYDCGKFKGSGVDGRTTEEHKILMSEKNGKRVICLETGDVYRSARHAAESIGKNKTCGTNIAGCCNGRYKSMYGYTWRWESEVIEK